MCAHARATNLSLYALLSQKHWAGKADINWGLLYRVEKHLQLKIKVMDIESSN